MSSAELAVVTQRKQSVRRSRLKVSDEVTTGINWCWQTIIRGAVVAWRQLSVTQVYSQWVNHVLWEAYTNTSEMITGYITYYDGCHYFYFSNRWTCQRAAQTAIKSVRPFGNHELLYIIWQDSFMWPICKVTRLSLMLESDQEFQFKSFNFYTRQRWTLG